MEPWIEINILTDDGMTVLALSRREAMAMLANITEQLFRDEPLESVAAA